MKLIKGMSITCELEGSVVDAKIQEWGGDFYICQDTVGTTRQMDQLGYKYSWGRVDKNNPECEFVKNIKVETDIESIWVGAIIKGATDGKRKILGICGEVIFISTNNFDIVSPHAFTLHELKNAKFTIDLEASGVVEEKVKEKLVDIGGNEWSESTVLAALKKYVKAADDTFNI